MEKRSDIPFDHVCADCEFCHEGERLTRCGVFDESRKRIVIKENGRREWAFYCTKNPDYIKEVHEYDPVCDEPGRWVWE